MDRKRPSVFERLGGKRLDKKADGHRDQSRGNRGSRGGGGGGHDRREASRDRRDGRARYDRPCKFWERDGDCTFGDACSYMHSDHNSRVNRDRDYGPKSSEGDGENAAKRGRRSRSNDPERTSPKRKQLKQSVSTRSKEAKKEDEDESEDDNEEETAENGENNADVDLANASEDALMKKRERILREIMMMEGKQDSEDAEGDSDSNSKDGKDSGVSSPLAAKADETVSTVGVSKLAKEEKKLFDGSTKVFHTGGIRKRRESRSSSEDENSPVKKADKRQKRDKEPEEKSDRKDANKEAGSPVKKTSC